MRRNFYAALLMLLTSVAGYAQQQISSTQTLRIARSLYEQGRLHDIGKLLRDNSPANFPTKEEKTEGFKLLCLTYIYLEEPDSADAAMLRLLQTNHYFEVTKDDPAEFVALYRTFRTDPIYRAGIKFGTNVTQPSVVSFLPASDGNKQYSYELGFQAGFAFELPLSRLNRNLTFAPELNLMIKRFSYENNYSPIDEVTQEPREYVTNGQESHTWISIPLLLQYQFYTSKNKGLSLFASAGVTPEYLLSAQNRYFNTKEQAPSLQEQNEDQKPFRNTFNTNATASLGTRIKVKGGFALAEVRYMYGLNKANEIPDIYAQQARAFDAQIVDGIFRLNSFSISVGYVYNIFNPKKIKR